MDPNSQNPNTQQAQPAVNNAPAAEKETVIDRIKSWIFELFLISLFTVLILATFNYFNLIPVSSVFPALSFLPQQAPTDRTNVDLSLQNDLSFFKNNFNVLSACNPQVGKDLILNQIVKCNSPILDFNTGKDFIYDQVTNSDIQPNFDSSSSNQLQINIALKIIPHRGYKPSGIMLGGDPTENRLFIAYDLQSTSWGVILLYGKKISSFDPLYLTTLSTIERANFSITISKDGKTVSILLPNGVLRIYNLEKSLYTGEGTIPSTLVVAPGSEVDLFSLNYLTP